MANLTIRNIPDELLEKVRALSEAERRSLNSELLEIIEKGLETEAKLKSRKLVSRAVQIRVWERIAGKWKDKRKTKDIIRDIYSARSKGRKVEL